jgi:hypothetical protein
LPLIIPMLLFQWKDYDENVCTDVWPRTIKYDDKGDCYYERNWNRAYYTAVSEHG